MNTPIFPKARIGAVPIHAMLVPFPIVCFTGAMLNDIVYSRTGEVQWSNFAGWFLAFGTFFGALAALFGLIDFFSQPARNRPTIGWVHMAGNILILLIALANDFVHARDGWTAVVPTGVTLSVITVILMVVTGFLGHRMAYRHVVREDQP